MDPEERRRTAALKWSLVIGGIVVFLLLIEGLQRLSRPESDAFTEGPASSEKSGTGPRMPEVRRLEDGAIELRIDFFRRSTFRLETKEDADALFDCLQQGIDETFGGGTEGWSGRRVREEAGRIQNECGAAVLGIPAPPSG